MAALVASTASLVAGAAVAAGIAVLIKAEPGLSASGKPIWTCTYVYDNRERTVVLEVACPPSIDAG